MLEVVAALATVALLCGALVVPTAVILGVAAFRLRRARRRSIAGAPPGFLPTPRQKQVQWWLGQVDGRAASLVLVVLRTSQGPGQGAGAGQLGLRLVLSGHRPALVRVAEAVEGP